ncbi:MULTISPECIES: CaiB/BaiF CoA transferase family protein [unclassified Ketobacter]|uniref:CaiB/BaiF CoA transferase family protein n=1 Tax=unclassified Ketobacter TaxID=2639109 RepID=UPI000F191582|nr:MULTISPECIES: CaiB/BaiF CoA-transferase family protein [unclassified Ketobacter]MCK5791100.1 CoA transferase [Ketobacter sp.]MEC8810598.1 CaiB/BaiF CoA-transferase family protein [Pseudomonadota bacterium]RLT88662.1 MAG: CoA transferase [Ketobacter sp. GenoA1]RLT97737.1 MAG: CoA transferase [Ketobacter sp.]
MSGPLSSLKVLDFTTLLPGPMGAMIMADWGADVVRVESPTRPDMVRMLPPMDDGVSACHGYLNRSKRSLALDLKKPDAVAAVKRLVRDYDIVVEQFRPGVMDRLGVGYEALKAENPGLIFCSITGYGQTGPFKQRAGHDLNYLSIAGVTGYNGRQSSGPAPINVQVADVAGGSYHSVMAILAAVIHRQQTGEGQHLDISMTDAAFSMHALTAPPALVGGVEPELEATQLNGGSFYDCYETADGRWLSVAGLEPQFFAQFCQAIGHPEWSAKGLALNPDIQGPLKQDIAQVIKARTFAEWVAVFGELDACVEPVLSFSEACEHPQILERELLVDVPTASGGTQRQLASPVKFSATPAQYRFTGAALGAHTDQVLTDAGFSAEEIATLKQSGATM